MDLTGFLFGNVNEEGELEDESLLDRDSVAQLAQLGVAGGLSDIVGSDKDTEEGDSEEDMEEDVAALEKSPTAQDFTDIAEVAEDDDGEGTSTATPSVESSTQSGGDVERLYQKGISFAQSQLAGPSSLLRSGGGQGSDDDYDDMETESSDQGYKSQTSFQPSDAVESQSAQQQHIEPQQEPVAMAIPVPSVESSLSSDVVGVASRSTTPTELPGTLDSGLGSDYELMSESCSQSQPTLELPLQHGTTSAAHSSSSPSPVQGSPAVAALPTSSEVSSSLQFGPSMSTTAVHLPTTSSEASGTLQLGLPMSTPAIPLSTANTEASETLQLGLPMSTPAIPLSTADTGTLQLGLPMSTPAIPLSTADTEASGTLQLGLPMSTPAIPLSTADTEASGTLQLGLPLSTPAIPTTAIPTTAISTCMASSELSEALQVGPSMSIPPISELGDTSQLGLSMSGIAMPTSLSTASPKASDTLVPMSTAAIPLPTVSSEASDTLQVRSSVSSTAILTTTVPTAAVPIPTASPEISNTLQLGPSVSTATVSVDSGYSTTTVLEPGSIPVPTVMSHSENLVPNPPLPSVPTSQLAEEQPPTSQPQLEASAIPALIPEDMSLEELHKKVKEHFPAFKPYGILRFLSLLGPGNPSSLPNRWKGAKKPKRGKKKEGEEGITANWKLDIDFVPPPEMCMSDDEDKFLAPEASLDQHSSGGRHPGKQSAAVEVDPETREWRFGPARIWYDMIGVPEDGGGLDYGFKLKQPTSPAGSSEDEGKPPSLDGSDPPDDVFLMVTQQHWENKILWEVPYNPGPSITASGGMWTTSGDTTTSLLARQLSQPGTSNVTLEGGGGVGGLAHSMFPIENYDLIYKRWEDDIIWDSEAVTHIPKPSIALLDPNDPNIILGIPEEPAAPNSLDKDGKKDAKKTSKFLINKKGHSDSSQSSSSFAGKKDPFNLSNDEYYNPKHVSNSQGLSGFEDSNVVQHSTPALDLYPPWFPTHLGTSAMRNLHRPKLKFNFGRGEETTGFYSITSLTHHIAQKEKERERERVASGGGEVFFMREPEDLSACDGGLILTEYCEQYPPLVSNIGMATKIKNYYRRPERQVKSHAPELEYGETTYVQNTSYFLGQLKPGQTLQSFENNLFRAPIYHHTMAGTNFLVILSGDQVFIREVPDVFVVGQECPKVEVPAPNSKPATLFQKEFLQVFLYRLFRESVESPRKIKMDVVRRAFPQSVISESVIRKVLKLCADFKREGYETGWWVLRSDFRLPSEDEIRLMITPEQVCAYHSMLAAEQRLKDAGYRGKSLFTVEEEEEDSAHKVDDEILAAPWNTTHHFVNAMKGKYQLSVSGPADPTGCGEGFSYTRLNTKRDGSSGSLAANKRYKSVMGTDGDLRKLKLSKARSVLRNFGVPDEEISKLGRWQVIDMVRALSTEAAKSGEGADLKNLKFARGARFSQMEAQEKYREECQRVFDLQNRVLASSEVLSTDEESSSSGGESDDELGRNLETLLGGKKTSAQLTHEQEEAERQELRRLLAEDKPVKSSDQSGEVSGRATPLGDADDTSSVKSFSSVVGRRLVISRTFCDDEGREYVRHEVVKNQAVIDAYIRLMQQSSGSKDVRSQFADQDEQTREDMKKEKRRIQDQLRRLKKLEEKAKKKAEKPQKPKSLAAVNMRCSACGQLGHMKTNKKCPNYKNNPVNVAPTDQELAEHESSLSQDDLVKVEGTKVVLHRAVVEHANDVRRKSLLLKFPKDRVKKRRRQGDEELDYLEKRTKSANRRKTNPEVPFSAALEKILQKLTAIPESYHFRKPVQAKLVPDYYNVIKFPMDLQTMKDRCRTHHYTSRDMFWEHVNLIVNNCITYNGFKSELTKNAQKMLEICSEEMRKAQKELEQLEQEINPALDDNAQVAFSFLLGKVVNAMTVVPDSWPFSHPVSAKKLPDYHKFIKRPMDLETMKKNCKRHLYQTRDQFLADVNQIVENSITYNGPSSHYTQTAERIRQAAITALKENNEDLSKLEARINEDSGSSAPTPATSPPSSMQDSCSVDMFVNSQPTATSGDSYDAMILDTGAASSPVDVEGWEEEEEEGEGGDKEGEGEGVDLLLQDLEHSSSSSESGDEEEEEESEMEDEGL